MDTMLNQGTPSAAGDMHHRRQENPTVVAADKRIVSPDTQLQIAEVIGYLANQVLINRPELARDLDDLLTPKKKVQGIVDDEGSKNDDGSKNGILTEEQQQWISDTRNTLMVVAVMIASVTFQAAINPPGGLWQDWKNDPTKSPSPSPSPTYEYEPGEAVNQDMHTGIFICFMFFNGLGLVASLSIILLLTHAIRIKHMWQVWLLVVIMWICVTSVAMAFIFGIKLIMHDYYYSATPAVAFLAVFYGAVVLWNLYRLVRYLNKEENKKWTWY